MSFFVGNPSDIALAGDWDGDGVDTLGINRSGHFFLTNTNATFVAHYDFYLGALGDRAFGGDADGNGRDNVFLYRQSDGYVYYTNETPVGPDAVAAINDFYFFGISSDRFVLVIGTETGLTLPVSTARSTPPCIWPTRTPPRGHRLRPITPTCGWSLPDSWLPTR